MIIMNVIHKINMTHKTMKNNHLNFEMVYDKFFHKLVAFVNSYINNIEEAKDIAQNSLVTFWEKRDQLKQELPIEPFLFTIAKNGALDYLRSFKVRLNHAQTVYSEHQRMVSELHEISLELFDVEKLKANILKKKIFKVLLTLPISDRKIFVLSRFNNLTNSEIAQILNISPKTVEKRISLILKILRKNIHILFIIASKYQ